MSAGRTRVAITTLGCKTNQYESAALAESLENGGFEVVPFDGEAEIYVINSCTVTARTDAESRKLIRRAKRRNPAARVVVTGCYAQVDPAAIAAMPEVELVVGNEEKKRLVPLLNREGGDRVLVSDIGRVATAGSLELSSFSEHTRAFLQVQNGCDSFCSYCIVPYARGRSRSVPPGDVLAGVARFAAERFREVVLTGIHLGNYGRDLSPQTDLAGLLREIERLGLDVRLRLGSLEPQDITGELIDLVATSPLLCPHLHIPLQSGSDTVLARMNRRYDSRYFRELCARIVAAIPGVSLGFDVIAGFPGETDAEFDETVALIGDLPAAYLHVFPFSSRPGTAAAAMPGHLPPGVVADRAARLRDLGEQKRLAYLQRYPGRTLELLVLQKGRDGLWNGLSANYLNVAFAMDGNPANSMVTVRIVAVEGDRLIGTMEDSINA